MPVVLIQVDAQDNATAGIGRVTSSLSGLDRTMGSLASSSSTVQAAWRNLDSANARLDSGIANVSNRIIRQTSTFQQAQAAADAYRRQQELIASGADTSAAAINRADRLLQTSIATQSRAAVATQQTARAYQQLAAAQDSASMASSRLDRAVASAQTGAPTGASGGSRGGGGGGMGMVGSVLLYGIGYQLMSTVQQSISQGFQASIAMQKSLYGTQATTGISASTRNAIGQNAMDTAASGKSIYGAPVLAQSAYDVASVGITSPSAIKQVTDLAMQSATASGAPDPAPFTAAITGILQSYGFTSPTAVAANARQVSDQAMMAVNLGRMDPKDMPGAVGTFGTAAAHAGLSMSDAFGLFAQNTRISRSAQQSAQDTFSFVSTVTDPNKDQKRYAAQLGVSDYFGPQAFRNRTLSQWETGINAATQGPNQQLFLQKLMGQVNSANLEMGFLGPKGSSLQNSLGILQQQQGAGANGGATKNAYDTYMAGPAGKYESAQVQFNTAVQTFAGAVMPFATGALALAASALKGSGDVLSGPGGQGGLGASWSGADRVLQAVANPFGPDFMNVDKAKVDVGRQMQQERADAAAAASRTAAEATFPTALPSGIRTGPPLPTDYQNEVTRRSFASRTQLGNIQGNQIDALTAQRQSGAALMAGALSRGQHIAVSDADARLQLAISQHVSRNILESAAGIDRLAVKEDATISGVQKTLRINAINATLAAAEGAGIAGPAVKAFAAQAPGLGGLLAGPGTTALRFGGGKDDQMAEIRKLREQLSTANHTIATLLGEIAVNTKVKEPAAPGKPYRRR